MEPSFSEEDRRDAQLEAIFRAHFAGLYQFIYRQVRHAAIAEDLTSAVFLKALRWLQEDRSPQSVKGWLYATARSIIADYWHERAQLSLLPLEAAEELPMLPDESDEQVRPLQARLQRLLGGLSSRERDVLTMRFFQGYSAAEIGQVLGLSANYVRVLQLRALRRAAFLEAEERNVSMETPDMPYNEKALRVLELAKEEARDFNHNYIGTEHLLLGIMREGSGAIELVNLGLTFEGVRGGINFIVGGPKDGTPPAEIDFNPRTKKVLVIASHEARRAGETAISPRHLLIAIMREEMGIAAQLLMASEIRMEQIGESVRFIKDPGVQEPPLTLPTDFLQALEQEPEARATFEKLSYIKRKRYVDWMVEAKGEAERRPRIATVIAQLDKIRELYQKYS